MMGKRGRHATYYARKNVHDNDIMICAGDVETEGLGGKLLMVQWGFLGSVFTASGPDMVSRFFEDLLAFPKPAIW